MKLIQLFSVINLFFIVNDAWTQADSTKSLSFNAYGELYYSYDFSEPYNHEKAPYVYNYKRHNELNANLLLLSSKYRETSLRANLALMAGNYAQYNLASEADWAKFIYEANVGIKLSKKSNLWLDVGVMPSHIGFESAIGADCWTLTRSIMADNSPYYETGLKLGYINRNEKWMLSFLLLNGWQQISKMDASQYPSTGIQINYKPTSKLLLNYSNFLGSVQPDEFNSLRTYHNVYIQYDPFSKLGFLAGFDIGQDLTKAGTYSNWTTALIIVKYSFSNQWRIAGRAEYYLDKDKLNTAYNPGKGVYLRSQSVNLDYQISGKLLCRFEAKANTSSLDKLTNHITKAMITAGLSLKI
ncbi:MAG TPA: outer membrane beta-barrel protein [Saprospiraceae bacterium]|nr:outer membrane beta-barrel protein [Saprospiraceae bacterium]